MADDDKDKEESNETAEAPDKKEDSGAAAADVAQETVQVEDEAKQQEAAAQEEKDETKGNDAKKAAKKGKRRTQEVSLDEITDQPSGKRARKSAESFQPDDFSSQKHRVEIPKGRGMKLKDIPSIRKNIESNTRNSEEILSAHRLLFTGKKMSNKFKKGDLLEFCGYLEADVPKEDQAKVDEEAETKMSQKAYKLHVPEIKMLCDFFDVDRSAAKGEKMDKDELINRLLDFLGAPDKKLTKSGKKTATKNKKAKEETTEKPKKKIAAKASTAKASTKKEAEEEAKEKSADDDEDDSEDDDEEGVGQLGADGLPTDKALRDWVKAYIACFNLDKVTTKHALDTASDKFGMDLTAKKALLKEILAEEM